MPDLAADFDADHRAAADRAKAACREEDWAACLNLAEMLYNGPGTLQDMPLGTAIFWMGCHAEHRPSCTALFRGPSHGDEHPFDGPFPAVDYFNALCVNGDAAACRTLAERHAHFERTSYEGLFRRDHELAKGLADMACVADPRAWGCPKPEKPAKPDDTTLQREAKQKRADLGAGCAARVARDCAALGGFTLRKVNRIWGSK